MAPKPTCLCGDCRKCKHREYMRGWYAKNATTHRETARRSRMRRLESVRAYDRARGFRVYDPSKVDARRAVKVALLNGKLTKQPCEVCGNPQVDGHHDDYDKPLDVRWLCRQHHGELHRRVAA